MTLPEFMFEPAFWIAVWIFNTALLVTSFALAWFRKDPPE